MINTLNELSYDDISIGQRESFMIIITASMVEKFSNLSGDLNPLHMDNEFAESSSFKKRIVHGMLLASFFFPTNWNEITWKKRIVLFSNIEFSLPLLY